MNTPVEPIDDTISTEDDLLQLQLRIARRADELARSRGRPGTENPDRECWLEAEREVLNRIVRPAPA